jgi:hypothetical protein
MTIRIRMKKLATGPRRTTRYAGQVYDVPKPEAEELIDSGYAEMASGANAPETASLSGGSERAMLPAATSRASA